MLLDLLRIKRADAVSTLLHRIPDLSDKALEDMLFRVARDGDQTLPKHTGFVIFD